MPIRQCMGCGERAPQSELVRITCAPDGSLEVVARGGCAGRSGYLHRRAHCWTQFATRKGPVRSLGRAVDKTKRNALLERLKQIEPSAMMR